MDDIAEKLVVSGFSFVKSVIGIITTPYSTYRRLIERGKRHELLFIAGLCMLYFALASLVKTQAFQPVLLTQQFIVLASGASIGYLLMVTLMMYVGKILGGSGVVERVAVAWGYSLIPTVIWFGVTSLLYVFLPPPRTQAPLGILFSLVYLLFSAVLFFWKAELYYLTLRFGMRLNLPKIIAVSSVLVPVLGVYSVAMYKIGIFRIPFL